MFRGNVNGRPYRADLDLYGSIAADQCCWEMKSNEPVLKLVKQKQGLWDKLVKNKVVEIMHSRNKSVTCRLEPVFSPLFRNVQWC